MHNGNGSNHGSNQMDILEALLKAMGVQVVSTGKPEADDGPTTEDLIRQMLDELQATSERLTEGLRVLRDLIEESD